MPQTLGSTGGFVASGWRMLVPPEMLPAARENVQMQRGIGINTEIREGPSATSDLEWLNPDGVAAVVYEPDGGYADPVVATEAYVRGFEAAGGTFKEGTKVLNLLGSATSVTGVETREGKISAGGVVNASGPWAAQLAATINLPLPMRVIREQDTVWEARPGRPLPDGSLSNAVDAIYLRPLGQNRFVVGRGFPKVYSDADPDDYNQSADEDFVTDVHERLVHRIPSMQGARRIDAYAALYDVTPDWYPFVGPRTGVSGYYDACGGSGHGFKLAPAIGKELANYIVHESCPPDFRQLSHDRLAAGELFAQKYGGNRG
jgi:glycine/D-amino acid oxidase-like deaminating enzyme